MTGAPRIVLTRQAASNRPWAERLRAAGHDVLDLPLVRFDDLPLPADIDPADHDWILVTSPQGARALAATGLPTGEARFAALGAGTASALTDVGLRDDLGVHVRDGAELADAFVAHVTAPATVLLPGPARRLTEPRARLEAAGFTVTELPLYATTPIPAAELPAVPCDDDDLVFFCSPSTVRAFTGAWDLRPPCVAIGETTAVATVEAGFATRIADTPDLEAMVLAAGLDPLTAPANTENGS